MSLSLFLRKNTLYRVMVFLMKEFIGFIQRNSNGTRLVHNPAILIPLVENGNPATFAVIHAIFENSGKK